MIGLWVKVLALRRRITSHVRDAEDTGRSGFGVVDQDVTEALQRPKAVPGGCQVQAARPNSERTANRSAAATAADRRALAAVGLSAAIHATASRNSQLATGARREQADCHWIF